MTKLAKVEQTRRKLQIFLLEHGDSYTSERLVRGAKNRFLFREDEDDTEVYESLVRFAKFHGIKLHTKLVDVDNTKEVTSYIEGTDDDGNSTLIRLENDVELKNKSSFLQTLLEQRDIVSMKLLKINNLISIYENN